MIYHFFFRLFRLSYDRRMGTKSKAVRPKSLSDLGLELRGIEISANVKGWVGFKRGGEEGRVWVG